MLTKNVPRVGLGVIIENDEGKIENHGTGKMPRMALGKSG